MLSNFQPSLKRVLVHEGGYSNHPKDPGGATMKGVIQRVYDAYREDRGVAKQSVRFISNVETGDIYRRQYWDAIKGDDLPLGLDYVVFDGAVNSGPKQSLKWLQKALAALKLYAGKIDGVWGLGTKTAVAAVNDIDALIARICDVRFVFLKALKTWSTFGKGWSHRVNQVGDAGQDWANGSVPSDANTTYIAGADAKAVVEDAKPRPTKAVADAAVGGGISVATAAQGLQEAIEQLTPLAGTSTTISTIVAFLTVAGVAITAGGIAWRFWQKSREYERADALNLTEVAA